MTDRLSLIKARHAEAGGGDGDLEWLIAEVERLRAEIPSSWLPRNADEARGVLDEAMSSGDGSYKP